MKKVFPLQSHWISNTPNTLWAEQQMTSIQREVHRTWDADRGEQDKSLSCLPHTLWDIKCGLEVSYQYSGLCFLTGFIFPDCKQTIIRVKKICNRLEDKFKWARRPGALEFWFVCLQLSARAVLWVQCCWQLISLTGSFLLVVSLRVNGPQSMQRVRMCVWGGCQATHFPQKYSRRESLGFKNKRKPKSPTGRT